MKKIISIILTVVLAFSIIGCSGKKTDSSTSSSDSNSKEMQKISDTHIGGAILKKAVREESEDIYSDSGIQKTDKYGKYTKEMIVYGITFIASDDIPDEYLLNIAKTTKKIFAINENTNQKLQEEVLQNMYKYKALVPVVHSEEKMADPSEFLSTSSICDIIMYESHVRAMEVIEHILHTVTDVGLHYADTEKFGITETSELYNIMQKHIKAGDYDTSSYKSMPKSIQNRVLIQEFIYWGITSEWDIQKKYGTGEKEWAFQSSDKMKTSSAEFHKLYQESLKTIISSPNTDMLDALLQ